MQVTTRPPSRTYTVLYSGTQELSAVFRVFPPGEDFFFLLSPRPNFFLVIHMGVVILDVGLAIS